MATSVRTLPGRNNLEAASVLVAGLLLAACRGEVILNSSDAASADAVDATSLADASAVATDAAEPTSGADAGDATSPADGGEMPSSSDAGADASAPSPTDGGDAGPRPDAGFSGTDAGASGVGHPFPRIGTLQWGGGTVDWMSRFQLVITSLKDASIAAGIQQAAPDRHVLWTTDWNAGGPFSNSSLGPGPLPSEWRLKTSTGADVTVYDAQTFFADITEYCAPYSGTVNGFQVNAERYNQALPRYVDEVSDWSAWDGVSSDGSWQFPWLATDVDLDRNGVNDFDEVGHGATATARQAWIQQKWWEGQDAARSRLRAKYQQRFGDPNSKLITYWTIGATPTSTLMSIDYCNGVGWENMFWNGPARFADWPPLIRQWESRGPAPRVNYVSGDVFYDGVHAPSRRKDYFRFVRWALATTLLDDAYFISGDLQNHHWSNYYDEYDVKLGYPEGPATSLANGGWVRFFDGGAVLVNPTNSAITISDLDLRGLPGYAGPYFRFRGNQDPVWNDGTAFVDAHFPSTAARTAYDDGRQDSSDRPQNVGEGLLLVKAPDQRVVADIFVDNAYAGTSPGSLDTTLSGDFAPDLDAGHSAANPVWTSAIRYQKDWRYYSSHAAPGVTGAPTATAVFRPGIHLAGTYRVYEWHGWAGASATTRLEAAAVPVKIVHAGGTASHLVDQTTGSGRWNLLGTYSFSTAGSATVTLTNDVGCANCWVIADAFRFEYVP